MIIKKKITITILAFFLLFSEILIVSFSDDVFASSQERAVSSEIFTSAELLNILNSTSENGNYVLKADITINSSDLTEDDAVFSGMLDGGSNMLNRGKGYQITVMVNNPEGSRSLFNKVEGSGTTEAEMATLKNLNIVFVGNVKDNALAKSITNTAMNNVSVQVNGDVVATTGILSEDSLKNTLSAAILADSITSSFGTGIRVSAKNIKAESNTANTEVYASGMATSIINSTFTEITVTVERGIYAKGSAAGASGFAETLDGESLFSGITVSVGSGNNGDGIFSQLEEKVSDLKTDDNNCVAIGFANKVGNKDNVIGKRILLINTIKLNIDGDISAKLTSLENTTNQYKHLTASGFFGDFLQVYRLITEDIEISLSGDLIAQEDGSEEGGATWTSACGFAGWNNMTPEPTDSYNSSVDQNPMITVKDINLSLKGEIKATAKQNTSQYSTDVCAAGLVSGRNYNSNMSNYSMDIVGAILKVGSIYAESNGSAQVYASGGVASSIPLNDVTVTAYGDISAYSAKNTAYAHGISTYSILLNINLTAENIIAENETAGSAYASIGPNFAAPAGGVIEGLNATIKGDIRAKNSSGQDQAIASGLGRSLPPIKNITIETKNIIAESNAYSSAYGIAEQIFNSNPDSNVPIIENVTIKVSEDIRAVSKADFSNGTAYGGVAHSGGKVNNLRINARNIIASSSNGSATAYGGLGNSTAFSSTEDFVLENVAITVSNELKAISSGENGSSIVSGFGNTIFGSIKNLEIDIKTILAEGFFVQAYGMSNSVHSMNDIKSESIFITVDDIIARSTSIESGHASAYGVAFSVFAPIKALHVEVKNNIRAEAVYAESSGIANTAGNGSIEDSVVTIGGDLTALGKDFATATGVANYLFSSLKNTSVLVNNISAVANEGDNNVSKIAGVSFNINDNFVENASVVVLGNIIAKSKGSVELAGFIANSFNSTIKNSSVSVYGNIIIEAKDQLQAAGFINAQNDGEITNSTVYIGGDMDITVTGDKPNGFVGTFAGQGGTMKNCAAYLGGTKTVIGRDTSSLLDGDFVAVVALNKELTNVTLIVPSTAQKPLSNSSYNQFASQNKGGTIINPTFVEANKQTRIVYDLSPTGNEELFWSLSTSPKNVITLDKAYNLLLSPNKTPLANFLWFNSAETPLENIVVYGAGRGSSTNNAYQSISVENNMSQLALMEKDNYTIDILQIIPETLFTIKSTAGEGGYISPTGDVLLAENTDKTFTITANSGYKIKDVLIDGVSVNAVGTYTFNNVTVNHTISAIFEKLDENNGGDNGGDNGGNSSYDYYTIECSADIGGNVTPNGIVTILKGDDQNFIITPNNNYQISDVLVDGKSVGTNSSYLFKNVSSNHTIHVKFKQKTNEALPLTGDFFNPHLLSICAILLIVLLIFLIASYRKEKNSK